MPCDRPDGDKFHPNQDPDPTRRTLWRVPDKEFSMIRLAVIVLGILFAAIATGIVCCQSATITWGDGTVTTEALVPAGGGGFELLHRNPGRPDAWGQNWVGQPVAVERVVITAPGLTILGGDPFFGAKTFPNGDVELLSPASFHYPHRRNGVSLIGYEAWPTKHLFDGGSHVAFVRLAPASDPWEVGWMATFDPAVAAQIRAFVREDLIAKHPWFEKPLDQYTYDDRVLGGNVPGSRTFGWLLVPQNFMARWTGQPGGLPAVRHLLGFGTRAPGNSLNNEHEGHDWHWIVQACRKNNVAGVTVALALARRKVADGLIDCDQANVWKGRWRNENGDMARGTTGFAPSESKAWDAGLVWMNKLTRGQDPILARGVLVRATFLKTCTPQWKGAGGGRGLAHYLENLEHHFLASGDPQFAAQADAQVIAAFDGVRLPNGTWSNPAQWVGTKLWLPNQTSGSTNEMCYEEGAHAALARWIRRRPATLGQYEPRLKAIVEHTLTHVVAPSGRVGYKWNPTPNMGTVNNEIVGRPLAPLEVTWGGDWNGAWLFGLRSHAERWWPGRFTATFDKIESYVANTGAGYGPIWDACYGPKGPGHEKEVAFVGEGLTHLP